MNGDKCPACGQPLGHPMSQEDLRIANGREWWSGLDVEWATPDPSERDARKFQQALGYKVFRRVGDYLIEQP